jgi:hypothetical protein
VKRQPVRIRAALLLVALLTLAATAAVPKWTHAAALGVVWRHTFESRLYEPERMLEAISFDGYLHALWLGLKGDGLFRPSFLLIHLGFALWGFRFLRRRGLADDLSTQLGSVWMYVPLHFLLFPDRSDRFFAPTYILSALLLLGRLRHWDRTLENRKGSTMQRDSTKCRGNFRRRLKKMD